MSRTMDNDAYNGLYAQHIKSCATIIALRSQIDKQEQQLQAYETQITLQEDGPASLLERLERQKRDLDYYASEVERLKAALVRQGIATIDSEREANTLRARVEELEGDYDHLHTMFERLEGERNEYRLQLAILQGQFDSLVGQRDELREQLAKLQPAKPSVVKQTWHSITKDTVYVANISRERCDYYAEGLERIAVLRRDHMSDGTVVCSLETV